MRIRGEEVVTVTWGRQVRPAKEKLASKAEITARVPWAAVNSSITKE